MMVLGLNNKSYNWFPKSGKRKKKSSYHLAAIDVVKDVFVSESVLQEVLIPGSLVSGSCLTLDFYIPKCKMAIEVQGEQHRAYISHFHGNKLGFLGSLRRDQTKKDWCIKNGIKYVALDSDLQSQWRESLVNARKNTIGQ